MRILLLSLSLLLCNPRLAICLTYRELPAAGISDEYLGRLGRRNATALLSLRLNNTQYSEFQKGIVRRLDGLLAQEENQDGILALERFVAEGSSQSLNKRETQSAICQAMKIIGARGGKFGVEVLGRLLSRHLERSHGQSTRSNFSLEQGKDYRIIVCGLIGIGLNGSLEGQALLDSLKGKPPAYVDENRFREDSQYALELSRQVHLKGLNSVYDMPIPAPLLSIGK